MRKERTTIPVRVLELNTGQVDWLPRNPRQWTDDDVARTEASVREDPDFLEDRPLGGFNREGGPTIHRHREGPGNGKVTNKYGKGRLDTT